MSEDNQTLEKYKKYYPFVFPTIALLLVLFLAFRWYNLRTKRNAEQKPEVQIENLTVEEQEQIVTGDDESVTSVDMTGEATASGQVRYTKTDDKVLFSVNAALPKDSKKYQVWLQRENEEPTKAFALTYGKGGYMGSASVPVEYLPFEVIVTEETNTADDQPEMELMRTEVKE